MISSIQLRLIAIAISVVLVLGLGYYAYYSIRDIGYQEATIECNKKFSEYQKKVDERIDTITTNINTISDVVSTTNENLSKDITKILNNTKNMPINTIKNGKCVPTEAYVKNVVEAINRANTK
jgi:uncharacterized protein YwgA